MSKPIGTGKILSSHDGSLHKSIVGLALKPPDVTNIEDPAKKAKDRLNFYRTIVSFNYTEAIFVFILMLNSLFFPNYLTSVYFFYSLVLTGLMMNRDSNKIRRKF